MHNQMKYVFVPSEEILVFDNLCTSASAGVNQPFTFAQEEGYPVEE